MYLTVLQNMMKERYKRTASNQQEGRVVVRMDGDGFSLGFGLFCGLVGLRRSAPYLAWPCLAFFACFLLLLSWFVGMECLQKHL
jgi:hypothetical protein